MLFRYVIPSRKTLTLLQEKQEHINLKIQADIKECLDMAITHDGWTTANIELRYSER